MGVSYAFARDQPGKGPSNPAYRRLAPGERLRTPKGSPTLWAYSQSKDGLLNVEQADLNRRVELTAYSGELNESLTAITQISAQYGILSDAFFTEAGDGSVTTSVGNFVLYSGTGPDGRAYLRTRRAATARPGQGAQGRFSAVFGAPVDQTLQAAGVFNPESGYFFSSFLEAFGIAYSSRGVVEQQALTVTVAGTGAATVTVDGIPYVVVLAGATPAINAAELAQGLNGVVPGYRITANQAVLLATATEPGPAGAFGFTGSTAAATWAQLGVGRFPDTMFIPQPEWNVDPCTWLDPTRGNSYLIQVNYGYSGVNFFVEEPVSSKPILVHSLSYANAHVEPNVTSPEFWTGWFSQSFDLTASITLRGASAGSFLEGQRVRDLNRQAINAEATVGATLTSVLAVRNRVAFGTGLNFSELYPILLSAAAQANKPTFFRLILNPVFAAPVVFSYYNEAQSVAEYTLDNVAVSGGSSFGAITVTTDKDLHFNALADSDDFVLPGDILVIAAQVSSSAATADVQVSFNWEEDY
jgi:hypothetical protein